jgi:hypothetical protein
MPLGLLLGLLELAALLASPPSDLPYDFVGVDVALWPLLNSMAVQLGSKFVHCFAKECTNC